MNYLASKTNLNRFGQEMGLDVRKLVNRVKEYENDHGVQVLHKICGTFHIETSYLDKVLMWIEKKEARANQNLFNQRVNTRKKHLAAIALQQVQLLEDEARKEVLIDKLKDEAFIYEAGETPLQLEEKLTKLVNNPDEHN